MFTLSGWRDFDDTVRAFDLLQRRIDDVFDDWAARAPGIDRSRRSGRPPWPAVNAFETKEAFVYKAQVPGVAESDVSIYVEDEHLVLRGERKADLPADYTVHARERAPVAFARKLPVPGRVDGGAVGATLKDGILTITLPKAKESLPRQITVKAL